jgi:hypothetical protein
VTLIALFETPESGGAVPPPGTPSIEINDITLDETSGRVVFDVALRFVSCGKFAVVIFKVSLMRSVEPDERDFRMYPSGKLSTVTRYSAPTTAE